MRTSLSDREPALIGIDGGGTKTEFLLFRTSGEILRRVVLSGSNPNSAGMDAACAVLKEGVDRLISEGTPVQGAFAGIAGAATGENAAALEAFLQETYPALPIRVGSDILNVMDSVRGAEKCIAVICGTGSAVFARDADGLHRAGGWGHLFDGAGSGYDIGRDALRYCLEYETGLQPNSLLVDAVTARLGGSVLSRLDVLYANGTEYIASFAPIVLDAYDAGDAAAAEILRRNLERIARLINHLDKAYDCGDTLILAGGLTSHRELFRTMLPPMLIRIRMPVFPIHPPVYGACLHCMQLFGPKNYDENAFDEAFAEGYEKLKGANPP